MFQFLENRTKGESFEKLWVSFTYLNAIYIFNLLDGFDDDDYHNSDENNDDYNSTEVVKIIPLNMNNISQ